jgi:hypothetical protein
MDTGEQYSNNAIPVKLMFYLVKAENFDIIDYHERTVIAHRLQIELSDTMNIRHYVSLLFPILQNETSKHVKYFVKIDAFQPNNKGLDFQGSWYFDLLFPFLPVQRLVASLTLVKKVTETVGVCTHGNRMPYINTNTTWCSCKDGWRGQDCNHLDSVCHPNPCFAGSLCIAIGRKPVCICPSNRYGPTCRVTMAFSCIIYNCKNNGTCFVVDIDGQSSNEEYYCACTLEFTGERCEKQAARLNIHFHPQLRAQYSSISAMIVHLTIIENDIQSYDTYRRLFNPLRPEFFLVNRI